MKKQSLLTLYYASILSALWAQPEVNGPDYSPPFDIRQSGHVDGELRGSSFLDSVQGNQAAEAAALVFGNKRVAVREFENKKMMTGRDNQVTVFVNDEPILELLFVAGYRASDGESVSITNTKDERAFSLETDEANQSIRWRCRYPLPDGSETEFTYTLKSLGNSQVELSWDMGFSPEQRKQFRSLVGGFGDYLIYLSIKGDYNKDGLMVNGSPIQPFALDLLKQHEKEHQSVWDGTFKDLAYASLREPLYQVSIHSEKGIDATLREIFWYRRVDLGFMLRCNRPQDSLVIDFGDVSIAPNDTPPPVQGVDMWAQDALHLPDSPTRNLFPNPSIEQGLRYWRWWDGGAHYERSDVLRYDVDSENALFGSRSLVINPAQTRSLALRSFSLPSAKGETYAVSFYAKAEAEGASIKLAPFSSKQGGQFTRPTVNQAESYKLGPDWTRHSYSFTSDGSPISFILLAKNSGGKVWIDGIQYEVGDQPSDFVAPLVEGQLLTSHLQNNVEYGDPIEATFALYGSSDQAVDVQFTLRDFYEQAIWHGEFSAQVGETLSLPLDALGLQTGAYFLQAHYEIEGSDDYDDYYRFTVIDSLDGTHATKNMYSALLSAGSNKAEERMVLMERLGFGGSTSYGPGKMADPMLYEIREKFNVTGYGHGLFGTFPYLTAEEKFTRHPDYAFGMTLNERMFRRSHEKDIETLRTYSPEVLARVEAISEKAARICTEVRVWHIATEEEGTFPSLSKNHDFEEFAKLQEAFYRGIKRGNPDALVLPSGGTSGYGKMRGKDDIEGYLAATAGKIKWDAIAIHPYGSIDGTLGAEDLDEAIQMLKDSMAQYDYGDETPIYLNEGGGGSANLWGDGPDWSYKGGQPSYDQGLHEFLHAAKLARMYLIALKYWPQLEMFNTWQMPWRTIVDYNLTPTSAFLGINTLGHMLGNPAFVSDIRPAEGVRGYAFEDEGQGAVAAIWCTIDDVERGFIRGPVMRVQFEQALPELIDLMGRRYELNPNDDGSVEIQLTPAPLFLQSDDTEALVTALQNAEVLGAGASVRVAFQPTLTGSIEAALKNLTGSEQSGQLVFDQEAFRYEVPANATESMTVFERNEAAFGAMYTWSQDYTLKETGGEAYAKQWDMDYFYIPKVDGTPDWSQIPTIPITNSFRPVSNMVRTPGGHEGDISAEFQVAWDAENLYLRVEAEDDNLNDQVEAFWSSGLAQKTKLYMLDGCLEVYLDCGANGRKGGKGFDLDDYRYDFSPNNPEGDSGSAFVYRMQEVFQEYAGGVEFPTKEEAAAGIKAEFTRLSENRYAYTITFEQKYIAPLKLEAGNVAGFGLYLHDRMDDGTLGNKGLSLATQEGVHCDYNPQLWPLMIFAE